MSPFMVSQRIFNMVQNYTIVLGQTIPEVITKVNALIAMGWQPQGSIAFDTHKLIYMQAMWTDMK